MISNTQRYLLPLLMAFSLAMAGTVILLGPSALLVLAIPVSAYLVLRWPTLAIYALIFSLPFEGIPLMEKFSITRLAGIGAAAVFIVLILFRRIEIRIGKLDLLVFIYYTICLASLIWAVDLPTSLDAIIRLTMIMAMYLILANFCTSEERAERILWVYALGCVLSIIIALATGRAIVQGDLFRLFGTIGDPNEFVQAIAVAFPFLAYVSQRHQQRRVRWFALVATALFMVATVLSGSRAGLLWLILITGVLGYRLLWKERRIALLIPAGFLIVSILYFIPQGTIERLMTVTNLSEEKGASTAQRVTNYQAAIQIIVEHPMGVGLRNFKQISNTYGAQTRGLVSHNIFLEIGTGVGLFGSLFFLGIIFFTLRYFYILEPFSFYSTLYLSYFYGYLGFLFLSLFLSSDLEKMTFLLPAIASGLRKGST